MLKPDILFQVGMATNIPPHNLGELVDVLCALIHNPEATVSNRTFTPCLHLIRKHDISLKLSLSLFFFFLSVHVLVLLCEWPCYLAGSFCILLVLRAPYAFNEICLLLLKNKKKGIVLRNT
jgi:hypothetical protein